MHVIQYQQAAFVLLIKVASVDKVLLLFDMLAIAYTPFEHRLLIQTECTNSCCEPVHNWCILDNLRHWIVLQPPVNDDDRKICIWYKGFGQTSSFSCPESNANELKQRI